ncbi:MAG: WD40 repeat domain-containing protein [Thermoguttaceae bacterium]|nr:WD40 repeat domain-containing protein [Thermoguttaceae bacterium]
MEHTEAWKRRYVFDVAFSPDGSSLASCGSDYHVSVWNVASGDLLRQEVPRGLYVWQCLAWSPAADQIALGGHLGEVRLLDAGALQSQWHMVGRAHYYLWDIQQAPDRKLVGLFGAGEQIGNQCTAIAWRIASGEWEALNRGCHRLVFSESGQLLAWTGSSLAWLDPQTRKPSPPLKAVQNTSTQEWSPDARWMAYPGEGNSACVVDVENDRLLHRLEGHTGNIQALDFSSDGKKLATTSPQDRTLRIWNLNTGSTELVVQDMGGFSLRVSPDNAHIVVGQTAAVSIVPIPGGDSKHLKMRDPSRVWPMQWSLDGKVLYARQDATISAWRVETSECLGQATLAGPAHGSFSWFGGGTLLATTNGTNMIYFRNPEELQIVATLMLLPEGRSVLFTPQGHFHSPKGVEDDLAYVVLTDTGEQLTLTPAEFEKQYGWKNDPAKVPIDGITGGATAGGAK